VFKQTTLNFYGNLAKSVTSLTYVKIRLPKSTLSYGLFYWGGLTSMALKADSLWRTFNENITLPHWVL